MKAKDAAKVGAAFGFSSVAAGVIAYKSAEWIETGVNKVVKVIRESRDDEDKGQKKRKIRK
jgi:hypothetical protein